jgi:phospholipase/carboxylesterase
MRMRAWYDLYDLSFDASEDLEGIERARDSLLGLIERERQHGIDSSRILLAGFSQGGAVVLHTALRFLQPLAGVLALSTYLPAPERLATEKCADPGQLVIRMDHGVQDPVVPYAAARQSAESIRAAGFAVDFHDYTMEHSVCPEQIADLHGWMRKRLG